MVSAEGATTYRKREMTKNTMLTHGGSGGQNEHLLVHIPKKTPHF